MSGLIQHEIDHLDGVFFLDHLNNEDEIVSIDYLLKDNHPRLTIVREMIAYMTS